MLQTILDQPGLAHPFSSDDLDVLPQSDVVIQRVHPMYLAPIIESPLDGYIGLTPIR